MKDKGFEQQYLTAVDNLLIPGFVSLSAQAQDLRLSLERFTSFVETSQGQMLLQRDEPYTSYTRDVEHVKGGPLETTEARDGMIQVRGGIVHIETEALEKSHRSQALAKVGSHLAAYQESVTPRAESISGHWKGNNPSSQVIDAVRGVVIRGMGEVNLWGHMESVTYDRQFAVVKDGVQELKGSQRAGNDKSFGGVVGNALSAFSGGEGQYHISQRGRSSQSNWGGSAHRGLLSSEVSFNTPDGHVKLGRGGEYHREHVAIEHGQVVERGVVATQVSDNWFGSLALRFRNG